MTEELASISLVGVYSATAVYTIAFIAFTLDLAKRTAERSATVANPYVSASASASVGGGTAVLERTGTTVDAPAGRSKWVRIAMSLTVLGWLLHIAATVLRGIAAERVPWANMFEFSLTATAIIVGVFLGVQFWQDLRYLGAYLLGFVVLALGIATVNFYVDVAPLVPALQSAWLVIHVFVAALATGFLALGAGLSVMQILQARREASGKGARFLGTLPDAHRLEMLAYRLIVVGFVFWTFTLIAGAIWAERAWGRYWGWDTKEVWTFIIWTLFAGYIHARATRGWRGTRSSWLAIIGFAAIVFNFTVVNLFFKGLHAYSGL